MSFEDVLRFIAVFASGIGAGILVVAMAAIVPAMLSLPDSTALSFKQRFDPLVDRINPPLEFGALIAGALVLIVADDAPTTATVATIVGLAGTVGVAATSLGVNMRINRRMASWSPDAPPSEFRSSMKRWRGSHAVRTLSGVTAFAAYLVAAIAA